LIKLLHWLGEPACFGGYENGFSQKKEKGKNICTSRLIAIFFLVVSNLLPSKTKFFKKAKVNKFAAKRF
jgi:hypothetical protein